MFAEMKDGDVYVCVYVCAERNLFFYITINVAP